MAPPPRKVLFVEDEAALQYSYERFFEGKYTMAYAPNGAGKTTLLKVLAGLIQPQRGRAEVDGVRRAIGWIGHQPQLYGQLTIWENLRFWASVYDVPESEFLLREDDLLLRLGLQNHEHRRVSELSRGLVQRAAIARALIHDPRVLLLDEPFTGLDRMAAEELREILSEEAAEGRASVLVTHNVEEGAELATHIAFMRVGRFVHFAPRAGRGPEQVGEDYRNAIA